MIDDRGGVRVVEVDEVLVHLHFAFETVVAVRGNGPLIRCGGFGKGGTLGDEERKTLLLGERGTADAEVAAYVLEGIEAFAVHNDRLLVVNEMARGHEQVNPVGHAAEAHFIARLIVEITCQEGGLVGLRAAELVGNCLHEEQIRPVAELAVLAYLQAVVEQVVVVAAGEIFQGIGHAVGRDFAKVDALVFAEVHAQLRSKKSDGHVLVFFVLLTDGQGLYLKGWHHLGGNALGVGGHEVHFLRQAFHRRLADRYVLPRRVTAHHGFHPRLLRPPHRRFHAKLRPGLAHEGEIFAVALFAEVIELLIGLFLEFLKFFFKGVFLLARLLGCCHGVALARHAGKVAVTLLGHEPFLGHLFLDILHIAQRQGGDAVVLVLAQHLDRSLSGFLDGDAAGVLFVEQLHLAGIGHIDHVAPLHRRVHHERLRLAVLIAHHVAYHVIGNKFLRQGRAGKRHSQAGEAYIFNFNGSLADKWAGVLQNAPTPFCAYIEVSHFSLLCFIRCCILLHRGPHASFPSLILRTTQLKKR